MYVSDVRRVTDSLGALLESARAAEAHGLTPADGDAYHFAERRRVEARSELEQASVAALPTIISILSRPSPEPGLLDPDVLRATAAIELETIRRQGEGIHLVTSHGDSAAFARVALAAVGRAPAAPSPLESAASLYHRAATQRSVENTLLASVVVSAVSACFLAAHFVGWILIPPSLTPALAVSAALAALSSAVCAALLEPSSVTVIAAPAQEQPSQ